MYSSERYVDLVIYIPWYSKVPWKYIRAMSLIDVNSAACGSPIFTDQYHFQIVHILYNRLFFIDLTKYKFKCERPHFSSFITYVVLCILWYFRHSLIIVEFRISIQTKEFFKFSYFSKEEKETRIIFSSIIC